MSRIGDAFRKGKAFIPFITAGDPSLERTEEFILEMVKAGSDMVEIGIPFSDPIAEGPVIQEADNRALASGTTVDGIFEMVRSLREKTEIPLVFMTYLNPVFKYGYEKFFRRCETCGIDGIIIPDLPFEEKEEVGPFARSHGVDLVSLIAPTSDARIKNIAKNASGFLYVVSSLGVTGMRSEIKTDLRSMVEKVRAVSCVPTAVGFGINTPEQAREIAGIADGVIVGSAFVRIIAEHKDASGPYIYRYAKTMKEAAARG